MPLKDGHTAPKCHTANHRNKHAEDLPLRKSKRKKSPSSIARDRAKRRRVWKKKKFTQTSRNSCTGCKFIKICNKGCQIGHWISRKRLCGANQGFLNFSSLGSRFQKKRCFGGGVFTLGFYCTVVVYMHTCFTLCNLEKDTLT